MLKIQQKEAHYMKKYKQSKAESITMRDRFAETFSDINSKSKTEQFPLRYEKKEILL